MVIILVNVRSLLMQPLGERFIRMSLNAQRFFDREHFKQEREVVPKLGVHIRSQVGFRVGLDDGGEEVVGV